MALTLDQETQALALLRRNADAAYSFINEKTSGFWHGLISGDTGGGERTYVSTVRDVLIPELERTAELARNDDDQAAKWSENATYAENSLKQVEGYALDGTVAEILKATAVQTASDVQAAAEKVAVPLSFGAGLGLVLVLALVVAVKFGGASRST